LKIPSSVLLTVLITMASGCGTFVKGQAANPEAANQRAFTAVAAQGLEKWRSFFVFSSSGYSYIIRADGHSQSTAGNDRPRNFQLKLGLNGHLERFYFLEHEADLLMVYEVSDARSAWAYAVRLDQKTLKSKWIKPMSALNIGPALVEAEYGYLTAANLLIKIDLRSGDSMWQQEDLDKQYALSSAGFRLPSISMDRVFFQEDVESGKTLEVDKKTGKILSVKN
jgi:uncharacterized protein YceK